MTRLLLVHGSCHAAWCWRDVLPFLDIPGVSAHAIDLPGHGADATLPAAITLESYAQAICGHLAEPTVLVGHSAGGFAIAAAAERDPARVAGLIYLCAYVPAPGLSLVDLRRAGPEQPLRGAIALSADRLTYSFRPDAARSLFYHDCPKEAAAFALARLGPEPVRPQENALALTARAQALPRHAILTTNDRTIPPAWQARMAEGLGPDALSTLPTGHSPFFAAPQLLAQRLVEIARSFV